MAAMISRRLGSRLLKPSHSSSLSMFSSILKKLQNPISESQPSSLSNLQGYSTFTLAQSPQLISFSAEKPSPVFEKPQDPEAYPSQNPHFKHQEIEGPTVERDLSALAEETRDVLEKMMKNMVNSRSLQYKVDISRMKK
ncbi:hypothetical protein K1719_046411 [Acacia pycnantha]|nr:hypothetical protein K1719_046411 [Acacia pycnantha]